MSPQNDEKQEVPKKPTINESVDSIVSKKEAKEEVEAPQVKEGVEGVQTEVTEVMAGVEKPKEKVSERKGESGEKRDITGAAKVVTGAAPISAGAKAIVFPSEEVMVKKIRTAIKAQIKREWKLAKKAQGNLLSGGAQEYNARISRIRAMKDILAKLLTATFSFAKELYLKYFTPDGKRRPLKEIQ